MAFLSLLTAYALPAQLTWETPAQLNEGLPASVTVFETNEEVTPGVANHAVYVRADLDAADLQFKTVLADGAVQTPRQFARRDFDTFQDSVYVAVNGGFFSSSQSFSLAIDGGELLAPNIRALTRDFMGTATTYFPTRGAFGIFSDRTPDLGWVYTTPAGNTFRYPAPAPLALGSPPLPQPDATFPAGGNPWDVATGLGGAPVLIHDGTVMITDAEELIDVEAASRQPRTAIGYTAGGEVIILVVDGRQFGFAEGVTLAELAQIMLDLGCVAALNLDGGGSSGLVVNDEVASSPSDATGLRPVRTAFLIKKQNTIYDTEMPRYAEPLGNWGQTSNPGFFGPSPARITQVASPATRTATYDFDGLAPGKYRLYAWWVAAGNRATNTPYILQRGPGLPADTARFDQSTNGGRFNPFRLVDGSEVFEISGEDNLLITNDASGNGSTIFATVDAIQLERVGDAAELSFDFVGEDSLALGRLDSVLTDLNFGSVNSGVVADEVRISLVENGTVTLLGTENLDGEGNGTVSYREALTELGVTGPVRLRFELVDNLGRRQVRELTVNVLPDVEIFFETENDSIAELPVELPFTQVVRVRRLLEVTDADTLSIFRSVAGAAATPFGSPTLVDEDTVSVEINDVLNVNPGDTISYRVVVSGPGGRSFMRTFRAVAVTVAPTVAASFPAAPRRYVDIGETFTFGVDLDSRRPSDGLARLTVTAEGDDGTGLTVTDLNDLSGTTAQVDVEYTTGGRVREEITLRFEVTTAAGRTAVDSLTFLLTPRRGDTRMAVISDFNASFGSVTYEWQVDSIVQRIPRIWNPDMVICGGDMIAGQSSALTAEEVDSMWAGFDDFIAEPIRNAGLPFIFSMGNHDAAIPVDIAAAERYWNAPGNFPGWEPVDTSNYPFYMSFFAEPSGEDFYVAWNAANANISDDELAWLVGQLESPAARNARFRFVLGHLPLYAVSSDRNSAGNILNNSERLRALLEEHDVHTYISGHHHAFYPGKRGELELMNAGAAGSGPRSWIGLDERSPNTMTLMDVFTADNPTFGKDTIVYTTYETRFRDADDMPIFDPMRLPEVIFSFNGEYQLRRDIEVTPMAFTELSARNLTIANEPQVGGGDALTVRAGDDGLLVEGSFENLRGRLLPEATAVSLFLGRHAETGQFLTALEVETTDGRNGTFSGTLAGGKELSELLTVGAFHLLVRTDSFPEGEVRGQFYLQDNQAPSPVTFTDSLNLTGAPIRDEPAVLVQEWSRATDAESNPVTYIYQAATDINFENLLYNVGTGQDTRIIIPEAELFPQLGGYDLTIYRRVIATDGRNQTIGAAEAVVLTRSTEPIEGDITLPAPDYRFDCTGELDEFSFECNRPFATTGFSNGHGVTVDRNSRVWSGAFSGRLRVNNPDGSLYPLTSDQLVYDFENNYLTAFVWKGDTISGRFIRGLGTAADGNPLIVFQNSDLYKFDAETGTPLARWDGPTSLTNPTVDSLGRIFLASVVGNQAFLLEESGTDTFMQVRPTFELAGRPGVIRAAAISYDGQMIFVPSNGSPNVNRYVLNGDDNYVFTDTIPTANSSNSITTAPDGRVYTVVNRGQTAPRLVFRQYTPTGRTLGWELTLDEVASTDLRGVAFTSDLDSFYVVSSADGAIERYVRTVGGNDQEATVDTILTLTIPEARPNDGQGRNLRANQYVQLRGVVSSENQVPYGLNFYLTQLQAGIQVFNTTDSLDYQPTLGDSLVVFGFLRQRRGQLRVDVDSLDVLATDVTTPEPLNGISEDREGYLVTVDTLSVSNSAEWDNAGFLGFRVGTDRTEPGLFIGANTALAGLPVPQGRFRVTGFLDQVDDEAPFDAGYLIRPRSLADIELYIEPSLTATPADGCEEGSVTLEASTEGFVGNQAVYTWLRDGVEVSSGNDNVFVAENVTNDQTWSVRVRAAGTNLVYGYAAPDATETSAPAAFELAPRPRVITFTNTIPTTVGNDIRLIATASNDATVAFFAPDGSALNDGNITDAQLDDSGVYLAVATSPDGCVSDTATVEITVRMSTGTSDLARELGVSMFPNPARTGEMARLSFTESLGRITTVLYDVNGRPVSTRQHVVNAPGVVEFALPTVAGTYQLSLHLNDGRSLALPVVVY